MWAHLFVPPPSLCEQMPSLPSAVEQVVTKALSKDAGMRFATVSDFAQMLTRASWGEALSFPPQCSASLEETTSATSLFLQPTRPSFPRLPAQVISLIGRDQELTAACVLLVHPEIRLLTMTGPGGIGKTRLALSCVTAVQPAFRDGTCFVDLSSIVDPDQVVPVLIQTLGIKNQRGLPLIVSLKQVLQDKHLLLMLDNFEQVLDAAPLLLELLEYCPELKLLVTSRSVLHVPGEHVFPVPPLAVPASGETQASGLLANASIALFVERARALKPDFQMTPTNVSALVTLCRELDGLPLALELAAARVTHLSLLQMLARLSRRLDLLAKQGNAAPTRQQTMRQAIGWSYGLLCQSEQLLLARLSVFVGGCSLSDVEALYTRLGDDPDQVLDGVASLIDKSLIVQKGHDEQEARLSLLELIREFGHECLEIGGELTRTRAAHAQHYASLVPIPDSAQLALAQKEEIARLKREYLNLLAALYFLQEQGEMEQALCVAVGMGGSGLSMAMAVQDRKRWNGF